MENGGITGMQVETTFLFCKASPQKSLEEAGAVLVGMGCSTGMRVLQGWSLVLLDLPDPGLFPAGTSLPPSIRVVLATGQRVGAM